MENELYLHNVTKIVVVPTDFPFEFRVEITLDTSRHYKGIKVRKLVRRRGKRCKGRIPVHSDLESQIQKTINQVIKKKSKVTWTKLEEDTDSLSYLKYLGAIGHQIECEKAGACEPYEED